MYILKDKDTELVTVKIHKLDSDILNYIAKLDDITLAHALSMQFSGLGLYNKKLLKVVKGDKH